MRVLHLIDPDSPEGGPCTLRLLADVMRRLDAVSHEALIVGGREQCRFAQRCGVREDAYFCPPRALPWAASAPVRKFMLRGGAAGRSFDLIHAWTARTAAQASLAASGEAPGLATLHVGPTQGFASRYALRVLVRSRFPLLTASMTVRREYRARGIPADRLALLPSAIAPDSGALVDRAVARARWCDLTETDIDENVFVIGALSEPANWIDARAAASIVARIALSGRRIKLVLHPRAVSRKDAARTMRDIGLDDVLVLDEAMAEPWRIMAGLDAALVLGAGRRFRPAASVLPTLWALAAGVPVVAEASDALRDIVDDGVHAMLVMPRDGNAAADRLAMLHDHRDTGRGFGENGKALVADMFDIESYCERLKHAYDLLLADRSVRIFDESFPSLEVHGEEAVAA